MIFAAGLGTRLGAIGRSTPKALIEIAGQTMLERTARRLVAAGADRIIVNVHHQADRIVSFIAAHDLGAEILVRAWGSSKQCRALMTPVTCDGVWPTRYTVMADL